MLTIYKANATSFSNLGLGVLTDFYSDPLITEVLNGEYNLEFEYLNTGKLNEYIVEENIIKAKGQLFRIRSIEKDSVKIKVLAKHIFFDLEKNFLVDVAPTNKTSQGALEWILNNAEESTNFTVSGDCTLLATARYVRKNIIEAIYNADNALLIRFGGELELDNFNVTVHKKRGKDLGFEIRQGKNLSAISFKLDFSTVATRIMPQGKDELLLEEKYVDSPLINNYVSPIYKKVEFSEAETREELINGVNALFEDGIDKPEISISIDFIELSKTTEYKKYSNLETAHLGDTCKAYVPFLNLNYSTRIVKTVYNCNLNRITKIELGTPAPNYVSSQSNQSNEVKNQLEKVNPESILTQAKESATELINHPFNGYIYISEETGEMYLMDTNDVNTATKIWKFGLGGIGYSSTGINGTFETAITSNGEIVADFVTTGSMSTSRIQGLDDSLSGLSASIDLNQDNINLVTKKVENDFYTKEQMNELILNSETGLTNIFKNVGGNNLLKNSALYFKTGDTFDYWTGNAEKIIYSESQSNTAIKLKNNSFKQSVSLANGNYTLSFKYKRLNELGSASVNINNETSSLDADGEFKKTLSIETNQMELEFNTTLDDSYIIYDLMLNTGIEASTWSQYQNEVHTDTVNISKGVEVEATENDTKAIFGAKGLNVINKYTNADVLKATDTGIETTDIKSDKGAIGGMLVKKVQKQTWITGV